MEDVELNNNTSGSLETQPVQTIFYTPNGMEDLDQQTNHHVGTSWKKLLIIINDATNAELLIKMRYDNFKQFEFFNKIIEAYLADHPTMRKLIEEINPKIKKKSLFKRNKDQEQKNLLIKDFGLDENDIESIFDDIQKEDDSI